MDINTNEFTEKKTDGVFVFIGIIPNTEFVDKNLLDKNNYIITDMAMATKIKGLYAAGDVRSGSFKQVVCAASNGATASEYAGKYIDELKGVAYK